MNLKLARIMKGLTQWDISVKTGIPQSKLSLIERGYLIPKQEEKEKLAEILSSIVEDIFPEGVDK